LPMPVMIGSSAEAQTLLLHDGLVLQLQSHRCSATPPCRPCRASSSVFSATYFDPSFTISTPCRPPCEHQPLAL
jgi:hypothetical protein